MAVDAACKPATVPCQAAARLLSGLPTHSSGLSDGISHGEPGRNGGSYAAVPPGGSCAACHRAEPPLSGSQGACCELAPAPHLPAPPAMRRAIPGLGMFSEAYTIFSIGVVKPLQAVRHGHSGGPSQQCRGPAAAGLVAPAARAPARRPAQAAGPRPLTQTAQVLYPTCFVSHEACSDSLARAQNYLQVCGIICGMLMFGEPGGRATASAVAGHRVQQVVSQGDGGAGHWCAEAQRGAGGAGGGPHTHLQTARPLLAQAPHTLQPRPPLVPRVPCCPALAGVLGDATGRKWGSRAVASTMLTGATASAAAPGSHLPTGACPWCRGARPPLPPHHTHMHTIVPHGRAWAGLAAAPVCARAPLLLPCGASQPPLHGVAGAAPLVQAPLRAPTKAPPPRLARSLAPPRAQAQPC